VTVVVAAAKTENIKKTKSTAEEKFGMSRFRTAVACWAKECGGDQLLLIL
jgi:hypothetical protein